MNATLRRCLLTVCCFAAICWPSLAADETPQGPLPHWIWANAASQGDVKLTQRVELPRSIQSAELRFAADFCHALVKINGRPLLGLAPYCQLQTLDVTAALHLGENQLEVAASGDDGPAAIALSLVVRHQDGSRTVVNSNGSWQSADKPAIDLGAVPPEHWGVGRRNLELSPFENYEQWQQAKTDGKKITAPKFWSAAGFEVSELRVAQPDESSWISLAFDPQGRLTISREDQGFLRLTLDGSRNTVQRVEPIAADLKECRGLAYDGELLYANANNSLGLYRLKINEQGGVQQQELLREFPGKTGHGRNDLVFSRGPRPRSLYAIRGDSVELPKENFVDLTSPLNETRRKGPGREGSLLRIDPEGNSWELFSAGLRNPYGIALHEMGDPFTFDADNEFDMGMPWYRPTRILQLLPGGDTGYRESTGVFPPRFHDQPDHAPPLLEIGRSSPTSVMFGYDLNFPPPYRNCLFALDWTYGRVIAVHLAPRGATFRAAAELFLQGRPLNVTDVAAGPDGDMYLITGGRKTQSALYRVAYVGKAATEKKPGRHELAAREFSTRIRSEQAELLRGRTAIQPTQAQLAAADPVIRHAARIALERCEITSWQSRALQQHPSDLFALLALARARRVEDVPAVLKSLRHHSPATLSLTEQFVWLRIVNLCRETDRDQVERQAAELISELALLWKVATNDHAARLCPEGTSSELRQRITMLLGDLKAERLPQIAASLLRSGRQEDQLAALLATRDAKAGWTIETRQDQLRVLNEVPRMIGGAGLPQFEKWLRPKIFQTLSADESRQLAGLLQPKAELSTEPLPPPRKHVQKWTLADLTSLQMEKNSLGDAQRGAIIFRDALCSRCHRVNLRGAAVGPDLTHVSRRFSRRDMLESIVQPSLSVAENYRLETVLTEAGQTYTGRIIAEGDYRSEKLTLSLDPLQPGKIVELDKKEITEHRTLPVSPMPNGLLDTFSLEEIRDLLAYLEAGN